MTFGGSADEPAESSWFHIDGLVSASYQVKIGCQAPAGTPKIGGLHTW